MTLFLSNIVKKIFRYFSDEVLQLYIQSIFNQKDHDVRLNFSVDWEAKIYETGIWHAPEIWKNISNIQSDILLIHGQESDVISERVVQNFQKKCRSFSSRCYQEASHLIPFEKSSEIAKDINLFLS